MYARARGIAHEALRAKLLFRAETLAGLLDIGRDGVEFEASRGMLEEFRREGSGAYMEIYDAAGRVIVKSPSVGRDRLPDPPTWSAGAVTYAEVQDGPGSIPCTLVAKCFSLRPDEEVRRSAEPAGAAPPAPPPQEFRIQVALDSRERDRPLAELATFLAAAGAVALLLTAGAGLLVARSVLGPLRRMTEEAATLAPEDAGRRLRPGTVVKELHQLAETLNSALDRLGAALSRQRRFTSDASHELRTPVSVLIANAEHLLRRPRSEEEYREGLRRQRRTALRMKEITENLLTLARADAATGGIERKPVRLDEIALSVSQDFEPLAEGNGVRIECEPGGPVPVLGDALYLNQLVSNLVSNAVKFTPSGGRVSVRTAAKDGTATLEVSDTGRGIPPEHLGHIFERFYRVQDGRDRTDGAGLGLAIVDWIVKAHGGDLGVESRPGAGTAFRVSLPACAP